MNFRKPQRATTTIETDDDILIRKDGKNEAFIDWAKSEKFKFLEKLIWEMS
ncbi:hypothetical protein KKE26_02950 [bacterium]|nr:hypothetical protein [bacterium]MBU1753561.1 hypothetical protein [bacterium]